MGRELFIVARDRPELYRYLTQTFADAENVQVIWDRRTGERRQSVNGTSSERRRADRRARATVDAELRSVGYVFLTL